MTEIQYIFLSFHLITWVMIICVFVEIQSWKKEIRQHIDYDSSLRALKKAERNK